ncbi:MAG: AmmeMemoRadiSam system protein B [Verrucomicrobiota bacterium]
MKSKQSSPIRRAAVAGTFYEGNPARLRSSVEAYLQSGQPLTDPPPKGVIAPHAGYVYSGPIAGSAFGHWSAAKDTIRKVILLGPSHYVAFDGLALSRATQWETPLGLVPVDTAGTEAIAGLKSVHFNEAAHEEEHCLEVELPFLQCLLPQFSIVPVVVGDADPDEVAAVIDALWGGPETAFVISSDLSHYLDYAAACRLDRTTADAIEALEPDRIHPPQACGRLAIQGWLQTVKHRQFKAATADLRNSGDTAGSKNRVVGYGAFTFRAV